MVTVNIYEADTSQKDAGSSARGGAPSPGAESGASQSQGSQGSQGQAPEPTNQFSSGQDQAITSQAPSPQGGAEGSIQQADQGAPTPTLDFLSQSQSQSETPSPSLQLGSPVADMQTPQPSEQQMNEASSIPGSLPEPSANISGASPEADKGAEDEKSKKK